MTSLEQAFKEVVHEIKTRVSALEFRLEPRAQLYKHSHTGWQRFEMYKERGEWQNAYYCLLAYVKLCLTYSLHKKSTVIVPMEWNAQPLHRMADLTFDRLDSVESWTKLCKQGILNQLRSQPDVVEVHSQTYNQSHSQRAASKSSQSIAGDNEGGNHVSDNLEMKSAEEPAGRDGDEEKQHTEKNLRRTLSFEEEFRFLKGDNVVHTRGSDALKRRGTVMKVHTEDAINGLFYTIRTEDGREIQTTANRLARAA